MIQVVGFIFFDDAEYIIFFSRGTKLMNFVHFLWYDLCVPGS